MVLLKQKMLISLQCQCICEVSFPAAGLCLLTTDEQSTCNAQTAMLSRMVQTVTYEPGGLAAALLTRPQSSRPRPRPKN